VNEFNSKRMVFRKHVRPVISKSAPQESVTAFDSSYFVIYVKS